MAGLETIEYDKGLWVKHEYEAHAIYVSFFSVKILSLTGTFVTAGVDGNL